MSALPNVAEALAALLLPSKDVIPATNGNGGQAQRLNIIRQIPILFSLDQQGCLEKIFPLLNQQLRRDDVELHIEVADAYLQLLLQRLVIPIDYASNFLPSILFYLNRGDRGVFNVWCSHLAEVISVLPGDAVHKKIFPVAMSMSQLSAPVYHRAASARLLGRMCSNFDQHRIMKDVLPLIHSLSQDTSSEVRANACQQFHQLARGLPEEVIKTALIPSLIELARDEEELVRAEAIETIVLMLPNLSLDVKRSTMVPLVYNICQKAENTVDESTVRLAKHFADLLVGLDPVLPPVNRLSMIRHYCELASLGAQPGKRLKFGHSTDPDIAKARIVECRRLCAENFSRLAKFSSCEQTWQKLLKTFVEFSSDPNPSVRRTVAANLHEVSSSAGERMKVVRRVLIVLLKDPSEEVLAGLAPNLASVVDTICLSGIYISDQDQARFDLASAMTCSLITVEHSNNWRLIEELYKQMECAVRFLPSNYIYSHMVPLIFQRMHQAKIKPVQLAAGRTQLYYLRYNLQKVQREKIRSRLEAEFCHSHSCHHRILYLKLCEIARQLFSASYFKTNFIMPILSLADDPVPNCRLLVAKQLSQLRLLALGDGRFEVEVNKAIVYMDEREKDMDVREMLERVKSKPKYMPHKNIIPYLKQRPLEEMDGLADRKKFDEERKLAAVLNSHSIADPPERNSKGMVRRPSRKSQDNSTSSRYLRSNLRPDSSSDHSRHLSSSRTNTLLTNRICTCMLQPSRRRGGKPSLNMEISWLNLETELHEELVALAGGGTERRHCGCLPVLSTSDCSIFSAAFERDFFRDTGVHVVEIMGRAGSLTQQKHAKTQRTSTQPKYLAVNGRSKSFILPTTKISDEEVAVKPLTRIPVSGARSSSHRRSLDVTHLARVCEVRSRGAVSTAVNGGSRLPVR